VNARLLFRVLGTALAAVLAVVATSFVAFVLLLPAFMRHGPAGPIEPHWLGSAIVLPAIALSSALAGRSLVSNRSARLVSSAVLGALIGSLANLWWLGQQLALGAHRPQTLSGEHLLVLLLAGLAAVLGFWSKRQRPVQEPPG
jgi:energy-converting hydrogenase Eha subunit A